ncbi:MAG: hypothetical protein K8J08_16765 [Thermoanaerobaculia bacterium]|nr:hypothetical protein [Thermoanaerobaculia bacterium]
MKTRLLTYALLLGVSMLGGCGEAEIASTSEGLPVQPPATPSAADPPMEIYYVMDEQAQMPVYAIRGPVDWTLEYDVRWNFNNNVVPVTLASALTDPQETKRLQFFPDLTCYWLTGDAALNNPGQMNMGMLNVAPMEPKAALVDAVTQIYQADLPGLQITGVREVPGLPAALGQAGPNTVGVGLRAVFPWEGKRMEEEVYALYLIGAATLRGEAGVTTQTTWGLSRVHGFVTEEGQLDAHRSMFTYMVRSGTPNPAWVELHTNIRQQLDAQFQRELIDNRRAREAIMAQSRALAAENDAFRANIMQRHRAAMDTTAHESFIAGIHSGGSGSSSGTSSQEKYIDAIHDRETFHDPSTVTGTSQHGYADQHWSDGWGNYLHTDNPNLDPNLDPDIGSSVQWERLQRVE